MVARLLSTTVVLLLVPAGEGEGEGEGATAALHQHLLVEFALSLLQGALRKGIINPRAPGAGVDAAGPALLLRHVASTQHAAACRCSSLRAFGLHVPLPSKAPALSAHQPACSPSTRPAPGELLDPLLPLLVRALRSRHAPTVTSALQALSLLMQSQLAGLQKTAGGERRAALLQPAGCR